MRRACVFALWLLGCAHTPAPEAGPHHLHGEGGASAPIALPYKIVDGRTGAPVDEAALEQRLRAARVVYVGEEHPNPHHHAVEIALYERIYQLDPSLALGVEMLPRTLQAPLDELLAGKLSEEKFLDAVDWHKTWGYAWGFYAPLFRFSRDHHLQMVALNAPRQLVHAVAMGGVAALGPDQQKQLPEMQPGPEAHRELVREAFGAHPHGKFSVAQFERFYSAQLLWDETMAQRVAQTLAAPASPHRMLVVAGDGHVRRFAVPDRAARRGATPYLTLMALFEDDLADALQDDAADLLWVFISK